MSAPLSSAAFFDVQACNALMRGGSKTFFAASRVLPFRVRGPAAALYAFCRVADDAIDFSNDRPAALADLQKRLDAVYAGEPREELADQALAAVVKSAGIPRLLLDALLEGFAWDAEERQHETLEDVLDYSARVAGTVGAMMSLVMGTSTRHALARACELGLAMQLTNIARDVGEDAQAGRLYLPRLWLREAGVDVKAWMADPQFTPAIALVVQRLLHTADEIYARAESGVADLPRDCRPAIQAARLVYAEIGREIEAADLDSVNHRAFVSGRRKAELMARACGAIAYVPSSPYRSEAPMRSVRFLVDAAANDELPAHTFYHRTVRMIDMLERVEHRRAALEVSAHTR
jgi:phytoene synthase